MPSHLFTASELANLLQDEVTNENAATVERLVWGWLQPKLGTTTRPDPVPAQLWSWAVELGAIARENPSGLSVYQLGAEQWRYSAERRAEILAEVEASVVGVTADPGGPRGYFPAPESWPDPVRW